jgi:hypothetical protein
LIQAQIKFYFLFDQALQYQEEYLGALGAFSRASSLDPTWTMPKEKEQKLIQFLDAAQQLTASKGKLRAKKLHTMLQVPPRNIILYLNNHRVFQELHF